jgi:two-component system, OmpR family, sensor kinase
VIRRLPIRWRLTLAFTLAMAVVLGAVGLFLHLNLERALDKSVAESLRARADEVGALVKSDGGRGLASLEGRGAESTESLAQLLAAEAGAASTRPRPPRWRRS